MQSNLTFLGTTVLMITGLGLSACEIPIRINDGNPIEINLNIKIDQEVRYKIDKDVEDLVADNPDIF
jgi:hypothetical protein